MKRYILSFIFVSMCFALCAQRISSYSYHYFDKKGALCYVKKYVVLNDKNYDLITWLSPFPVEKLSAKSKISNV